MVNPPEAVQPDEESSSEDEAPYGLPACKDPRCCGKFNLVTEEDMLVPLSKVAVTCELKGAIAMTFVELTYKNTNEEKEPLECTFNVPFQQEEVLTFFEAVIDGKTIVNKVMEIQAAQEKYEDAVAGGNTAYLA